MSILLLSPTLQRRWNGSGWCFIGSCRIWLYLIRSVNTVTWDVLKCVCIFFNACNAKCDPCPPCAIPSHWVLLLCWFIAFESHCPLFFLPPLSLGSSLPPGAVGTPLKSLYLTCTNCTSKAGDIFYLLCACKSNTLNRNTALELSCSWGCRNWAQSWNYQ